MLINQYGNFAINSFAKSIKKLKRNQQIRYKLSRIQIHEEKSFFINHEETIIYHGSKPFLFQNYFHRKKILNE